MTMINKIINAFVLMGILSPCAAKANTFADASFELNDDNAQIRLRSIEPLDEPHLTIERGSVKVRFFGIAEQARLRPPVDGATIRSVIVRSGAKKTAVVSINLSDRRMLKKENIRIERKDAETRILIARSALPETLKPEPTQTTEPVAVARNSNAIQENVRTNSDNKTVEANNESKNRPETSQPSSKERSSTGTSRNVSSSTPLITNIKGGSKAATSIFAPTPVSSGLGGLGERGQTTMVVLAIASLLLFGVYGAIRFGLKKRSRISPRSQIEIIGTKRLGARHQLVLVRALGEDHLLSVNAGQTERIASLPIPTTAGRIDSIDESPSLTGLYNRWKTAAASSQEKADPFTAADKNLNASIERADAEPKQLGLLHFGKRTGRSPLEKLNYFEPNHAAQSETKRDGMRFRNQTVD
jgi:flagellar biogenesis protein FliO